MVIETRRINISDKIKKLMWEDVRNKRFTLLGMGSELAKIADKQSEKYKQLKNRYDEIEADIQEITSQLDGSYNAKKIIEDAIKAKEERDEAISRKGTKSKKLEERLETLELKREEEIQKIKDLRGRINSINLLPEDEGHDEVSQKAEAWKIENEMVKCSLNLRAINARIGMTKIRKSNQDAKDIENIKKVIDTYNEKIIKYKKEMDELNNKRPKSIPEEFMRENDWVLGVVTIDKNKKLQEVIDKIDEENREIREFGQEKYFVKSQKEDPKLPYKELNNEERNELIKYSEEMTTFKQLTEFMKIKAARAAGKVVGLTILAVRRIKSIFKPKEEMVIEQPTAEVLEEVTAEQPVEEAVAENNQKPVTKVEVRKIEQSNAVSKDSVNPFELRIAVDNNVKKAIEVIPTIERKDTDKMEKEIDTTTFE